MFCHCGQLQFNPTVDNWNLVLLVVIREAVMIYLRISPLSREEARGIYPLILPLSS